MLFNEYDMTSARQFRNYIHKYFIVFIKMAQSIF